MKIKLFTVLCITLSLLSCGGGESGTDSEAPENKATFEVLLMGNSHSSLNDLPGKLRTLIEIGTGETVLTANAPGWKFLDERLTDGVSNDFLKSRSWTHVILQAQKYSTSGLVNYSTEPSKTWIRRVKSQNASPIMFPEWPRQGNYEEGNRVHILHESIVSAEPACLAPIGLTWDFVILNHPEIVLHDTDGNHSNDQGALLTAYVLYETITKNPAESLPNIESLAISNEIQTILKRASSEIIKQNPPCQYLN